MTLSRCLSILCPALLLMLLGSAVARAAETPVSTRAARLTFVQGKVSVDRTDNTGSQPAQVNLPLLAGVRVSTGEDGQAEIEFEDGSLVRLTPNTSLSLDNLTVDANGEGAGQGVFTTGISLLHGLVYAEMRFTTKYRYTLDAGGDVVSPVENTTVRVSFDQPPAIFAVLDGTARVERTTGVNGSGYQREVRAGESLQGDTADATRYSLTQEIAKDSWDDWNQDRDQAAASEAASRTGARDNYAGAQGYGWSDLDANGDWYDVPGTGEVWQPTVAATDSGFDPYSNGSWTYNAGTGYVYASAYSWGWTPYRCGNWSYFNEFGWGWAPGGGCGGLGWGFAGGGRPVNILYWPNGYRVPHVPIGRPGPVNPIVPGRVATGSVGGHSLAASTAIQGPRRINGMTVMPLDRVGSGYAAHETMVGAGLERDFPVDTYSHAAVTGVASTQPAVILGVSGWRSTGVRPAATQPSYRSPQTVPAYTGRPAAPVRTQPSAAQTQHSNPVVHSAPPAPASHPAPAPASHGR